MTLGPIQKQWIENLRKYPDRQMKGQLASGNLENYRACCLGELAICTLKANEEEIDFEDSLFIDESEIDLLDFEKFGLFDSMGGISHLANKEYLHKSLAGLNDNGTTWPEIADMVEKNPHHFFTKSY